MFINVINPQLREERLYILQDIKYCKIIYFAVAFFALCLMRKFNTDTKNM